MKPRWQVVAAMCLPLLAACDRMVYVGRDAPAALHEASATEVEPEPPDDTMMEPLDAGATPTQTAPVTPITPPLQPETMQPMAPVCDAEHADCDLDASNGCEVDLMHDRNHCGSCSAACQTGDCSCSDGKLTLHCADKHADCDGDVRNGCEADLMTSMQHCGSCQRTCHANGHDVTGAMCVAGHCKVTCEPRISPEADCDGDPDNGCETYLLFDRQNCGACGNACLNCEAGTCMF